MNTTPEARLLLTCTRWFAGTASADDVHLHARDLLGDFDPFMELARAHWMEPLAAWCLKATCPEMLQPAFRTTLDVLMRQSAARHLLLQAELLKVLRIFDQYSIAAVPLKGPVLAAMLCDEVPWRDSADLDLLVRRADTTRAKEALLAAGYRLDSHLPHGEENAAFHWRSQLVLFRDGPGPAIDLHWQLLPSLFPCARHFDLVWERLQIARFHDREIRTFSAEDQLFFLCAHAARHSWQSLRLATDVARLIHVRPALDWDSVIRVARASDGARVLALGLWMVNRLLQVELPRQALDYVNAEIGSELFTTVLLDRLMVKVPGDYENSSEFWLQFKLASGWWPKLRCTAAYALLPADADGESLSLPHGLYFLYYVYRPVRLAVKYATRLFRSASGYPVPARDLSESGNN
jgi:Uncharacterised nucleotidyltransferase